MAAGLHSRVDYWGLVAPRSFECAGGVKGYSTRKSIHCRAVELPHIEGVLLSIVDRIYSDVDEVRCCLRVHCNTATERSGPASCFSR